MQWLNLDLNDLGNEAFGYAETADVGTWLRLMRYCCLQENGGRIRAARLWDDRKWMLICCLTKAEVDRKCSLWSWSKDTLIVRFFPHSSLAKVKRLRAQSAKANAARWGNGAPSRHPERMPHGMPHGMPRGNAEGIQRGIRKDKGKDKGKDKDKREHSSQVAFQPPTSAEVVAFFASEGAAADMARDFHDHFTANGWTQGGRPEAPLASWQPEASKWIRRERRRHAAQKSSGGGAAPAFDATAPNAHTGGIPLAN